MSGDKPKELNVFSSILKFFFIKIEFYVIFYEINFYLQTAYKLRNYLFLDNKHLVAFNHLNC